MHNFSQNEHPSTLSFEEFLAIIIDRTKSVNPTSENYKIVNRLSDHLAKLENAFDDLSGVSKKKKMISGGVEWFLDNFYILQEAIDLIQDDMPRDYFNKLPSIGDDQKQPRVYFLARNIIAFNEISLVQNDLQRFLDAYQDEINLNMSELWAFPLMLRLTLIEITTANIFALYDNNYPEDDIDYVPFPFLDPDEAIARAIKTLILLNRIEWKDFFETHSTVNEILADDPSKVYLQMDFETRDQYRKKIEGFAENCNLEETDVAIRAIEMAERSDSRNKKEAHVGFYLIGDGEEQLKSSIGFRDDFWGSVRKFFYSHNTFFYLGGILLITVLVVIGIVYLSLFFTSDTWQRVILGMLSLIPASSVAVNFMNSILTASLPAKFLPKMDFSKKIPRKFRTMVAIPALMSSGEDVRFLLNQIELHYLSNQDRNIGFILLLDFSDAPQETMPEDDFLRNLAIEGIRKLNKRYQEEEGRRPFFLYHRCRQWNPKEGVWMGWERKRGKLTDFNRYLLEGFEECVDTIVGDQSFLNSVKFVITLDADTILPRDSAKNLIGTLAHPLNRAEFKDGSHEVTSGYTILQPRTEVKPTSVNRSFFTRVFAGDLGLDLYTRAVSDVYQDLFSEGIFVGKGIYDVKGFQRSVEGKIPVDTLLSHDLFEGLQGQAGLVSDIVFYEDYPPNYASQVQRMHRWVRGDWQLLPWLFPKVPTRDGQMEKNPFSILDLWKIIDNLRRSLLAPATFLLLVLGWLLLNNREWVWTFLIMFISAFPLIKDIVTSLSSQILQGAKSNVVNNIKTAFYRWLFWLIFLPYESLIMVDAILTTLVRVFISHKRLLQWQTSAHTIRLFGKKRKIAAIWLRMLGAPIISIAVALFLTIFKRGALWTALPLIILWIISPQIAYWISMPSMKKEQKEISKEGQQKLRNIARMTWLYFERFIGPDDHWLPPDHYQEDPKGVIAHRTSPTNIGLLLLSTAAAYDFGYIGVLDFVYRINYSFETLDKLEKYRGHLLNWYDTQTLEPLTPRYVSTVDSGNFAVSVIGLYQTFNDLEDHCLIPSELFKGIYDSLDILCQMVTSIKFEELDDVVKTLSEHCHNIQTNIVNRSLTDNDQIELLFDFQERISKPMKVLVQNIFDSEFIPDPGKLKSLRYWSDSIFTHITNILRQIDILAPWIQTWRNRPEFIDEIENDVFKEAVKPWQKKNNLQLPLKELPDLCLKSIDALRDFSENRITLNDFNLSNHQSSILEDWLNNFIRDLEKSRENVRDLFEQIKNLTEKMDFYLKRMEFSFLLDKKREVFYLGYQVGPGRFDSNHYDLLASEARTASLFAIAENEVSRSHWLHMNRPFTAVDGIPTLISWNGSMFEYLMPNLFTKTYPETLLHQTSRGVVNAQIAYAAKNNVPWGISESGYYRFDQAKNYQYKGFGVPALGRKRGLADDLVITPYASLMAIGVDPENVLKNITKLEEIGALGVFGFYEAIDYTKKRLPTGKQMAIIKSYMAHHQGMIFVALSNFLNSVSLPDRIHNDPRIQSTELLLQEQIPQAEKLQTMSEGKVSGIARESKNISITPWNVDTLKPGKAVHVISNEKMRLLMSETGSGYLAWEDIAITRWREDEALDPWGIWFYIQDLDQNLSWSIGQQPIDVPPQEYRVLFSPHMMEIRHMVDDIRIIMQTTISPDDDVCFHKVNLTNQSNKKRTYRILSYGEVVLAPQATDMQHPAFNKLFIESKMIDGYQMLFFTRRKRAANEKSLGMAHVLIDELPGSIQFESNREKFIGRGLDVSHPIAIQTQKELSGSIGHTLDPIFSIGKSFDLDPNQTITFNYLTLFAEDVTTAKSIVDKYEIPERVDHAFTSAESSSEQKLRALELTSGQLSKYQQLLSRVIYPTSILRASPAIIEENVLSQSGLWSFGISGDYPILLVLLHQEDQVELIQEILLAHRYWHKLGLMIDLVILNSKPGGYAQDLNEKIHKSISMADSQNVVNQRGGIFVLTAGQIEDNALTLIKSSARVVINLNIGDLGDHLNRVEKYESKLPEFIPTDPDKDFLINEKIQKPDDLDFDNGIGGFKNDEYWIFMQDYPKSKPGSGQVTPAPWINVISNESFGTLISESGSGYTWSKNSGENRLTPWHNDPVSDPASECLYLRDEINGRVWSPTPQPSGEGTDYLVKHGQGYSIFESYHQGFKQELKIFVDADEPVKIVELKLVNQTDEHRRITTTYYAEWTLGPKRENMKSFIVPSYNSKSGTLFAKNTYNAEFSDRVAFLSANRTPHGLTTDRKEFFGSPGNRKEPAGLKRVGLSGKLEAGLDPCGALQTHWDFEPGETQTIIYVIGQGKNRAQAMELAEKFSQTEQFQKSWDNVQKMWDQYLNKIQVETPDKQMNFILNRWLLYQALSCRIWGRSAFYQSSGAYGFRDQLQDVASLLATKPEIARKHILRSAKHQFDAGDVLHWWHPPSGRGVRTRITDDLLWLVYITYEYIEKTGDRSILDEEIAFRIGDPLEEDEEERYAHFETTEEKYTLFEHCRRALDHGDTKGPHGLPLIGSGDWNDGMNRVGIGGKGESVWLAWFLLENHKRFAEICVWQGQSEFAEFHRQRVEELNKVINDVAWDDEWYLRAYYDDGTPLGSHRSEECQIDSLPQSWSVLTGEAPQERVEKALVSLEKHLVHPDDRLIQLFTPPFDKTKKDPGYIKGYPPGVRENGGQYTHAAIWAIWALTEVGLGNKAFKQFQLLNPISHSLDTESANRYMVEPYVIAADVYSCPPYVGRGGWTWYTGSSGWFYRLGIEAILGFSTAGDRLMINPCIPEDWDGFSLTYHHKNSIYHIEVENPEHVQKGVKVVKMDGKKLDVDEIQFVKDDNDHEITVIMGK